MALIFYRFDCFAILCKYGFYYYFKKSILIKLSLLCLFKYILCYYLEKYFKALSLIFGTSLDSVFSKSFNFFIKTIRRNKNYNKSSKNIPLRTLSKLKQF